VLDQSDTQARYLPVNLLLNLDLQVHLSLLNGELVSINR
jgi:hypothetical protein